MAAHENSDAASVSGTGVGSSSAKDTARKAPADRRVQRIADYLTLSLGKKDALEANLGAVNADLMLVGYRLKQAIKAAMERAPAELIESGRLMPAIDSYLKITRQIDRFAKLTLELAPKRKPAKPIESLPEVVVPESEETKV